MNQYNFRTKILKSIKHQPLNVEFLDDTANNVYEFFRFMMMVHSPITRRSIGASFNIADAYATYNTGSGMQFSNSATVKNDFAHRGVVNSDVGSPIQAIKITQIFMQVGSKPADIDTNAKEVAFFFINPRIENFDLDEMNHDSNELSIMTMKFDYDFMVMSDMRVMQPLGAGKGMPPVGSAPGEAAPTGRATASSKSAAGGGNNPYSSILAGVGGKAAQSIVSSTLGKVVRQVPGLGSVADTIGGIVQNSASNAIGSAANSAGGLIQGSIADRINGIGSSIKQSFARPQRAIVSDNSTTGQSGATLIASSGLGTDQSTPGG